MIEIDYDEIQLDNFIWRYDYVKFLNKEPRSNQIEFIKLGRAVFLKKDTIPKKDAWIIKKCFNLKNLYPQSAFFKIFEFSGDYNKFLRNKNQGIKIDVILAYDLKMIRLTDELIDLYNKLSVLYFVNSDKKKEEFFTEFQGNIISGY